MSTPWGRALPVLALWMASLGALTACDDAEPVVLEIKVHGDLTPGVDLDTLQVTIAASATATGDQICQPFQTTYSLNPLDAAYPGLPLRIAVTPGKRYDRILFVQVVGLLEGMVRLKTERMVSLQGGQVTLPIELEAACLGKGTGVRTHCLFGQEETSPYWSIFDPGETTYTDDPCLVNE